MSTGRSAKLYQERRGLRVTQRGPAPEFCPSQNLVHVEPLSPPLPLPGALAAENGTPPPDLGGVTKPWPHGTQETP